MLSGFIMMTALVPTIGHANLIEFAYKYLETFDENFMLEVMICGRTKEPTSVDDRIDAFEEHFDEINYPNIMFSSFNNDDAPQNPEDSETFWEFWKESINETCFIQEFAYVFASEKYGKKVAEVLGAEFIPHDLDRLTNPFSGSSVRQNILEQFGCVLPTFQKYLQKTVTVFGAESTGKTTLSSNLSNRYGVYLPEWARGYLEFVGPEVTDERMDIITHAQYALQKSSGKGSTTANGCPIIVQDTDLLSTIGYYRIYKDHEPMEIRDLFLKTKSDLYLVMSSGIPFEPDPLRYGGDKRESTDEFWINLLKEFDCNYKIIDTNREANQLNQATNFIEDFFLSNPIYTFVRD